VEIDRPLDLVAVWHGKYEAWILKEAKVKTETNRKTTPRAATR